MGLGMRETRHPAVASFAREASVSVDRWTRQRRIISIMLNVYPQRGVPICRAHVLGDHATPTPRETARRLFGRYIPDHITPTHTASHAHTGPLMTHNDLALVNHINELKHAAWASDSLEERYEAAVLLLDIYEQMLTADGLLEYGDEEVMH